MENTEICAAILANAVLKNRDNTSIQAAVKVYNEILSTLYKQETEWEEKLKDSVNH